MNDNRDLEHKKSIFVFCWSIGACIGFIPGMAELVTYGTHNIILCNISVGLFGTLLILRYTRKTQNDEIDADLSFISLIYLACGGIGIIAAWALTMYPHFRWFKEYKRKGYLVPTRKNKKEYLWKKLQGKIKSREEFYGND